jgi:hypothetical protein
MADRHSEHASGDAAAGRIALRDELSLGPTKPCRDAVEWTSRRGGSSFAMQ